MDIQQVFDALKQERDRQNRIWGTIEEHSHTVAEYILIMENQLEKAKRAWLEGGDKKALPYVKQTSAVGSACMEEHGIGAEAQA